MIFGFTRAQVLNVVHAGVIIGGAVGLYVTHRIPLDTFTAIVSGYGGAGLGVLGAFTVGSAGTAAPAPSVATTRRTDAPTPPLTTGGVIASTSVPALDQSGSVIPPAGGPTIDPVRSAAGAVGAVPPAPTALGDEHGAPSES